MTLLPHDNRNVVGVALADLPKAARTVKVGPECSNPRCEKWADHAHHIWRRSFIGADNLYVRLWTGDVVCNLVGLCWRCHDRVTKGEAQIVLNDSATTFFWREQDNRTGPTFTVLSALRYQPPRLDVAGTDHSPEHRVSTGDVEAEPKQLDMNGGEVPWKDAIPDEPERCDKCGRVKKRPAAPTTPGEVRPKKSWTVAVPVDHRENGYEVLDSLLLTCAEALGRDEHKSWRYYTLVEVLAWTSQHLHLLEKDAA